MLPIKNCSKSLVCQEIFVLSANFVYALTKIFMRPFPPLGTFTTFFSQNIFTDNGFDYEMGNIEREFHNFSGNFLNEIYSGDTKAISLYEIYAWGAFQLSYSHLMYSKPKFMLEQTRCAWYDFYTMSQSYLDYSEGISDNFPCSNQSNPCCNILTKNLIGNHLQEFMTIMKYSGGSKNFQNDDNQQILSLFSQKSSLLKNLIRIFKENSPIKMLLYCDMANDIDKFLDIPPGCTNVSAVSTTHGICQSFNSAPSKDIYKNHSYLQAWNLVFAYNISNRALVYPKGNGAVKGMYFVLNSYEYSGYTRYSNEFILSINNENNPYDIYKSHFNLLPGQSYSFKVTQSQIGTTSKFDSMNYEDRNCTLPNENSKLRYMRMYTKSACEYECALVKAAKKCLCIPWNLPRLSLDELPFCDMLGNLCFSTIVKKDSTFEDCNCPNDCQSTTLTIFDTSKQIYDFAEYCNPSNKLFYYLKNFTTAHHHFGLFYNHIVNDGPDPYDYQTFCRYLLQNHITIVKVELTTKRIMRSVRDKRFSFENQLSTLGMMNFSKKYFLLYIYDNKILLFTSKTIGSKKFGHLIKI